MTYMSCSSGANYCGKGCCSSSSLDNFVQYSNSSTSRAYSVSQSATVSKGQNSLEDNMLYEDGTGRETYVVNLDSKEIAVLPQFIGKEYLGSADVKKPDDKNRNYSLEKDYDKNDNSMKNSQKYINTIHTGLLSKNRPVTQFVAEAEDVEEFVREAFFAVTGEDLPKDIVLHVLSEEEMRKAHKQHGGKWNKGIMGFAVNNYPYPSTIFVRKNNLDALMLTIGHEIGHVLSKQLPDPKDEEAKAFAFELAWARKLVQEDIGGLAKSFNIDFMPANNGVHDKAFAFVQELVKKGKDALKVFKDICRGDVTVSGL